jgi:hypothetical protein
MKRRMPIGSISHAQRFSGVTIRKQIPRFARNDNVLA